MDTQWLLTVRAQVFNAYDDALTNPRVRMCILEMREELYYLED